MKILNIRINKRDARIHKIKIRAMKLNIDAMRADCHYVHIEQHMRTEMQTRTCN